MSWNAEQEVGYAEADELPEQNDQGAGAKSAVLAGYVEEVADEHLAHGELDGVWHGGAPQDGSTGDCAMRYALLFNREEFD